MSTIAEAGAGDGATGGGGGGGGAEAVEFPELPRTQRKPGETDKDFAARVKRNKSAQKYRAKKTQAERKEQSRINAARQKKKRAVKKAEKAVADGIAKAEADMEETELAAELENLSLHYNVGDHHQPTLTPLKEVVFQPDGPTENSSPITECCSRHSDDHDAPVRVVHAVGWGTWNIFDSDEYLFE